MLWSVSALKTPHPLGATSTWVRKRRSVYLYAGLIDVMRSTTQAFLAYMGSSWFDTLAICTVANNFAAEKGLALGLTKSLYGLSASLLTTAYENLFEPDVTQYLGFLTILIPGTDLASRGDLVVA